MTNGMKTCYNLTYGDGAMHVNSIRRSDAEWTRHGRRLELLILGDDAGIGSVHKVDAACDEVKSGMDSR